MNKLIQIYKNLHNNNNKNNNNNKKNGAQKTTIQVLSQIML